MPHDWQVKNDGYKADGRHYKTYECSKCTKVVSWHHPPPVELMIDWWPKPYKSVNDVTPLSCEDLVIADTLGQ